MEYKVALISEKHLKESSVIELNTDNKILSKLIIDSQKLFLRPILGNDLYNQILKEVYDNQTISGHEFDPELKELLDVYIQPYLCYQTLIDFLIVNHYKLTNKGVLRINESGATSITPDELAFAKNHFDNKAISYKALLIDKLKEANLIKCTSNNDLDIASDTVGWYLDGFKSV